MTTTEGLVRKHDFFVNHLRRAAKAGVNIQIAVPPNADKELVKSFSQFAKIKTSKNSTTRFCMVDSKDLLLFLTDDQKVHKSYDCAVWVEAPYFVDYFTKLFDNEWKAAK